MRPICLRETYLMMQLRSSFVWKASGRSCYQHCGIRAKKAEWGCIRHDAGPLQTMPSFRGRKRPGNCEVQCSTDTSTKQTGYRHRIRIADICDASESDVNIIGNSYTLKGWARTVRTQKSLTFMELNDGSSLSGIQVVIDESSKGYELVAEGHVSTGAAVAVAGELVQSPGGKQKIELKATEIKVIGTCDNTYPLQKKRHSLEYLRTIGHLRPRTNLIGAVTRVRNALSFATHSFFQTRGFLYINTPIITASDCEGAGELFSVTTLTSPNDGVTARDSIPTVKENGNVDFSRDFFGKPAFLTVSGQLNAEIYACALGDVYTFGPTFRAENSNTSRHLAEFWMIEPEMSFADLDDNISCAEDYIRECIRYALDTCPADMEFFDKFVQKGIISRLEGIVHSPFKRLSYTAAVKMLQESDEKFDYKVKWGNDLQSEHERFLVEKIFNGCPLIITDYPKSCKAFYMRENDDRETVAAMDILVPGVGELVGGSQREERLDVLKRRLNEAGLDEEMYWWYLDLRRYGSVPHAGFGLGFERLVQFATGVENIRDVIPFPRVPDSAEF